MSTSKKKKPVMRISQGHLAKGAIHSIDVLFKKLGLDAKAEKHSKLRQRGTSHVPTLLIEEVAAAADQYGTLIGIEFDTDTARTALAYAAAFEPVATKAEAFAQRVRDAILAAKSEVGSATLAAYASMKGVVRRPEGVVLRDSFDKMTSIMKHRRRGSRSTATVTPAATEPSAPPVASTPPPIAAVPKSPDKPHQSGPTVVVQLPQDNKAA